MERKVKIMAGYIFALNNIESLKFCIENGIYATNLSQPKIIDGVFIMKELLLIISA